MWVRNPEAINNNSVRNSLLDKTNSISVKIQDSSVSRPKQKLPLEIIQVLGDNSCPHIKKRNIFDIVAGWTSKRPPIVPENKYLLAWHIYITFIVLYYIFQIGLLWGYGEDVWKDELEYMYIVNFIFIVSLIIDCVISTMKAFYSHGQLVTHHRLIVKRYMRLRLWIDIIGIIALIIPISTQVYALNWVKVLFLPKYYTLYEIDKEFTRITQLKISIHTFYLLSRLVLFLILGSHYLGIWFYMIDYWVYENNYYGPNTPNLCWIYNAQAYSQMVLLLPWYGQYEYTMYFSVGTMTTIAYGDITPLNPLETIYIIFALFAYTIGFGYILSQILRILMEAQASKFQHTNNLLLVSNMMKDNLIMSKTQITVKAHFEKVWKEEIYRNREIQVQLIKQLPERIRNQLYGELYLPFFTEIGLLTINPLIKHYNQSIDSHSKYSDIVELINSFNKSGVIKTDFMVAIANKIQQIRVVEGYYLYKDGEEYNPEIMNNHSVYFIKEINKRKPTEAIQISIKGILAAKIEKGSVGIQSFYTGNNRNHSAKVIDSVLVYFLPRKILLQNLYLATPLEQEEVFMLKQKAENGLMHCIICNQPDHSFWKCPYVTYQPDPTALVQKYHAQMSLRFSGRQTRSFQIKQGMANLRQTFNFQGMQESLQKASNSRRNNSLLIFKEIRNIKYRIKNKYQMAIQNPYYSDILLGSKRSKHLMHTKVNKKSSIIYDSNLMTINQHEEKDRQFFGGKGGFMFRQAHSQDEQEDEQTNNIKKDDEQPDILYSSESSSSSSFSEDSQCNSSIDLQNYIRETEVFIQHLEEYGRQAQEKQIFNELNELNEDMGKDYLIYLPDSNPTNIINKYNESIKEWNRHRFVKEIRYKY